MNITTKYISTVCIGLIITSCSTIQKSPEAEHVRLIFNKEFDIASKRVTTCRHLGEIVGSDGHWYSYLFISNTSLTHGAFNDLHNKAHALGANIVYVDDDIGFSSSVTFYGQAYDCEFKQ